MALLNITEKAPAHVKVAAYRKWLDDHPDGRLIDRVACALMVVAKGEWQESFDAEEIAVLAGCEAAQVGPALAALRAEQEGRVEEMSSASVIEGDRRRRAL